MAKGTNVSALKGARAPGSRGRGSSKQLPVGNYEAQITGTGSWVDPAKIGPQTRAGGGVTVNSTPTNKG